MRTLLLLLALTACAPQGMHQAPMGTRVPKTTIVVVNYNWNDARVHVLDGYEGGRSGNRQWVGYVGSMSTLTKERLLFHSHLAFSITFLGEGRDNPFITFPVLITPGDIVELTIGANITMTRIMVVAQ